MAHKKTSIPPQIQKKVYQEKSVFVSQENVKASYLFMNFREVLSVQIAKECSKKDKMNYILENFTNKKKIFAIDPTIIGNIGRQINHSCDPNLSKHLVRVDTLYPRVALVAENDIAAGTELTFETGSEENKNFYFVANLKLIGVLMWKYCVICNA